MDSAVVAAATALRRVFEDTRALFDGAPDILKEGGILTEIYGFFDRNWG